MSRTKPPSKLEEAIQPILDRILNGEVLAIDPSSGSRDSLPGYAIFRAGAFVDGGLIQLPVGSSLQNRLYNLSTCLREQFKCPSVLVTEKIAPITMNTGFHANSMLSLQKSIGVVISSFDCPLLEVAPITWRKNIPENYVKRDDNDALMMAFTVIKKAHALAKKREIGLDEITAFLNT